MAKAASELVALALMMTAVSLSGVTAVFMIQMQEQAKIEAMQTREDLLRKSGSCLEIVSFDEKSNNIIVKNCGKYTLGSFYTVVDGVPFYSEMLDFSLSVDPSSGSAKYGSPEDSSTSTVVKAGMANDSSVLEPGKTKSILIYAKKGLHAVKIVSDYATAEASVSVEKEESGVYLSCASLPEGVSCFFKPDSITAASPSSDLIITIGDNAKVETGKTYIITVVGKGGSVTRTADYSLKVEDGVAPQLAAVAPPLWENGDVPASFTCSDEGSGCNAESYRIKIYYSDIVSCPNNYAEYNLQVGTMISSYAWVCMAAKDNAGNIVFSSPIEFKVDKTPPSGSLDGIPAGWQKTDAFISLSCSDSGGSGCDSGNDYYYIGTGSSCPAFSVSNYTAYAGSVKVGGHGWFCYSVADNAGNRFTSEKGAEIKIDKASPSASVKGATASWQNVDASASLECSDAESGCNSTAYRLKTYSANPGLCPSDYSLYDKASPQAISFHAWVCGAAKDNAGNIVFSSPIEFKVEKIPPAMDCSNLSYFYISPPNPTDYDKITVAAMATDGIGISKMQIYADGALAQTCTAYAGMSSLSCQKTFGAYGAGSSHNFVAKAYDNAGNAVECKKALSIVSMPAECKAAIAGQQCSVGDMEKAITCGCMQYVCR